MIMKLKEHRYIIFLTCLLSLRFLTCTGQSNNSAEAINKEAHDLFNEHKYLEAAEHFIELAETGSNLSTPNFQYIGSDYSWAGECYYKLGYTKEALKYFNLGLKNSKRIDFTDGIVSCQSGIGKLYREMGRYDSSIFYYRQAIEIDKSRNRLDKLAIRYSHIGGVYKDWGKYEEAFNYYKMSLEITEKLVPRSKNGEDLAMCYNNIALIYLKFKDYENAKQYLTQALSLDKEYSTKETTSTHIENLGMVFLNQNEYQKALQYLFQSYEIKKTFNNPISTVGIINNIGLALGGLKKYNEALSAFNEALRIGMEFKLPSTHLTLHNIGSLYYSGFHNYDKAIEYLSMSIDMIEKIRVSVLDEYRRDFTSSKFVIYQYLISSYIYKRDFINAFKTIEKSRVRYLVEKLGDSISDSDILSIKNIQEEIPNNVALIYYANINWSNPIFLVVTKDTIYGQHINIVDLENSILTTFKEKIGEMLRRKYEGKRWIESGIVIDEGRMIIEEQEDINILINFYLTLLSSNLTKSVLETEQMGKLFYKYLFQPFQEIIKDKTHIIILPDGPLYFLPFETLIDEKSKYIVEKYDISYVPSIKIMRILENRTYKSNRKTMLAFGGAVYNRNTYDLDMDRMDQRKPFSANNVSSNIINVTKTNSKYDSLGFKFWTNLPGTLYEIESIQKIVKDAELIKGNNVSLSFIKNISETGELANYKILHFATHGLVVPYSPELSALVLSQIIQNGSAECGYLNVNEIPSLNVKADFVCLSACETALGKLYQGEGVLGLAQSFMIAGANGICISLWLIEDRISTPKFMSEIYELIMNQDMNYSHAICVVKRKFIQGSFGIEYKKPFYWAPFVFYGSLSYKNPGEGSKFIRNNYLIISALTLFLLISVFIIIRHRH